MLRIGLLKALERQRLERIWTLAKMEFKLRYYQNRLGLLWAFFKPLADVLIYYLVFKYLLNFRTEDFVFYLFLGQITFGFFSECSHGKITFLVEKKSYYDYTNMNKIELYYAAIIANLIGFFFNLFIFFLFYSLFGSTFAFSWHILLFPIYLVLLIIVSMAFMLILSNAFILVRDLWQVWMIVNQLLFWTTPVIYSHDIINNNFVWIKYFHPVTTLVMFIREIAMYHKIETNFYHFIPYVISVFAYLIIGLFMLKFIGSKASEKL